MKKTLKKTVTIFLHLVGLVMAIGVIWMGFAFLIYFICMVIGGSELSSEAWSISWKLGAVFALVLAAELPDRPIGDDFAEPW